MSHKVMIHPKARKELRLLSEMTQEKITEKLKALSREFNKPKSKLDVRKIKGTKKDVLLFRLRVGDYRVVFEFADDVIWVAKISHRKDSYKGL